MGPTSEVVRYGDVHPAMREALGAFEVLRRFGFSEREEEDTMTMEEQRAIDAGRAQMAHEIVDGQAYTDMTIDDWKRFAKAWIVTAAQHASNEGYLTMQRDAAVAALQRIVESRSGSAAEEAKTMIGALESGDLPERLARDRNEPFLTGVYRHYKGGLYTALMLVTHHETREPMVLYVSHTTGTVTVRPLRPMHVVSVGGSERHVDPDAWSDWVEHEGKRVARFEYVESTGAPSR